MAPCRCEREGTNLKIYVNGVLEGTLDIGNAVLNNTSLPVYIGRIAGGYYNNSIFDDIRIYRRSLTDSEIALMHDEGSRKLKIENLYDDRGFRLAKVNHEENRTTWYIRDASGNIISVHEQEGVVSYDAAGVPQVKTEPLDMVEVPVYGSGKIGTFYPGQDGSMAYEITDHLGNVRALFRENLSIFTATMEDNGSAELSNPRVQELTFFEKITETAVTDVNMNHTTPIPGVVETPDKSAYLFWQDGMQGMEAGDKAVGPGIVLRINAGNKVELETWARFENKTTYTRDFDVLFLSILLGTDLAALPEFDGIGAAQLGTNVNAGLGAFGFGSDDDDGDVPFAYLNYVLFRDDYTVAHAGWRRVPLEAGFDPGEEALQDMHRRVYFESPVVPQESGYIYVWVSNESENTEVWFDDLKVTHTGTFVAQATDYGAWGDVLREQKTDESVYRFGYQGQFAEKDEETGWNHFELREYDALIGRWLVVDPYGQHWSPYVGMGNDPVNRTDPNGGFDDYMLNRDGTLCLLRETSDNFDVIFNSDMTKSIQVDKGFISNSITQISSLFPGKVNTFYFADDMFKAKPAFYFFSTYSNVEWGFDSFFGDNNLSFSVLSTSYSTESLAACVDLIYAAAAFAPSYDLFESIHSHPGEYDPKTGWPAYPSGFLPSGEIDWNDNRSDRGLYFQLMQDLPGYKMPYQQIYVPSSGDVIYYNEYKFWK